MLTEDFNFILPKELIATTPLKRGEARLLDAREVDSLIERMFVDLPNLFSEGDVLVLNNTKVIPSAITANINSKKLDINLIEKLESNSHTTIWSCFVKPAKIANLGQSLNFIDSFLQGNIIYQNPSSGERYIKFNMPEQQFLKEIDKIGKMPLPPYMKRKAEDSDNYNYQTVFAKNKGSVASPTAGLHFNDKILEILRNKGIKIVEITLHISRHTFEPIKVDNIEDHPMHKERLIIDAKECQIINKAIKEQKKIIAIGSTSLRALESAFHDGIVKPFNGKTDIFIKPGYKFKIADFLLTNFHLPRSTLFVLITAIVGIKKAKAIYQYAIDNKFRFFSYGDCCLFKLK